MTPLETLVKAPLSFAMSCKIKTADGYIAKLREFEFTSIEFLFKVDDEFNSLQHLHEKLKDITICLKDGTVDLQDALFKEELRSMLEYDQTNTDNTLIYRKKTSMVTEFKIDYVLNQGNMEQHPSYPITTNKHRELVMALHENETALANKPFVPGGYSINLSVHSDNTNTLFKLDRTLAQPIDLNGDYSLSAIVNHISFVLVKSLEYTLFVGLPSIEDIAVAVQQYFESTITLLDDVIKTLTTTSDKSDHFVFTNELMSLTLLKEI